MIVWGLNDHFHPETNEFKILAVDGALKQRCLIFKLSTIWIYKYRYNTGIIHISFLRNHQIFWKLVFKILMSFIDSVYASLDTTFYEV